MPGRRPLPLNTDGPIRDMGHVASMLRINRETAWRDHKSAIDKIREGILNDPELRAYAAEACGVTVKELGGDA